MQFAKYILESSAEGESEKFRSPVVGTSQYIYNPKFAKNLLTLFNVFLYEAKLKITVRLNDCHMSILLIWSMTTTNKNIQVEKTFFNKLQCSTIHKN